MSYNNLQDSLSYNNNAWLLVRKPKNDDMEHKFDINGIDIQLLRDFCEQEGEAIIFRKGEQLEREGEPAQWLAYVTKGCFKYVKHGVRDGKAHLTWFSFEGEFVVDYPTFLYGRPSQATIEAMAPSHVLRVSGEQLKRFFDQSKETMELRAIVGEHILSQFRSRYLDLHCTTPRERYDLLMQRCPGIVELLNLQDIASFLNISPQLLSKIRKEITYR